MLRPYQPTLPQTRSAVEQFVQRSPIGLYTTTMPSHLEQLGESWGKLDATPRARYEAFAASDQRAYEAAADEATLVTPELAALDGDVVAGCEVHRPTMRAPGFRIGARNATVRV